MLVDACQSVPHMVVDVRSLDTDFLVASSHKVSVFSHALMFNLASDYLYLRSNHASDVWAYRHWLFIWQDRAPQFYASFSRQAFITLLLIKALKFCYFGKEREREEGGRGKSSAAIIFFWMQVVVK